MITTGSIILEATLTKEVVPFSTAWVTRALSSLSRRPFARVKLFHSFLTARGALALLAGEALLEFPLSAGRDSCVLNHQGDKIRTSALKRIVIIFVKFDLEANVSSKHLL